MKTTHTAIVALRFLRLVCLMVLTGLTLNLNQTFAEQPLTKTPATWQEKLLPDPFTGPEQIDLVSVRLQTAPITDGVSELNKLRKQLIGVKIEPLFDFGDTPDVSVDILFYSTAGTKSQPRELVQKKAAQHVTAEQIILDMKMSGYRPATAEEMLAIRDKLTKTSEKVWCLGTEFTIPCGTKCHMTIDYTWNPGAKELPKIELIDTATWTRENLCLAGVRIEPQATQVATVTQPIQEAKK